MDRRAHRICPPDADQRIRAHRFMGRRGGCHRGPRPHRRAHPWTRSGRRGRPHLLVQRPRQLCVPRDCGLGGGERREHRVALTLVRAAGIHRALRSHRARSRGAVESRHRSRRAPGLSNSARTWRRAGQHQRERLRPAHDPRPEAPAQGPTTWVPACWRVYIAPKCRRAPRPRSDRPRAGFPRLLRRCRGARVASSILVRQRTSVCREVAASSVLQHLVVRGDWPLAVPGAPWVKPQGRPTAWSAPPRPRTLRTRRGARAHPPR